MNGRFVRSMRRLSPTCREAARLISDASERDLPRLDRIGLKMHLLICRACRSYRQSVHLLRQSLRAAAQPQAPTVGEGLSPAARQRILTKLREN